MTTEPPSAASRGYLRRGWRIMLWPVPVVVSFAIVAPVMWWSGLVTKNDLLDVFVGTGTSRYSHLAIFVGVWALVMTVLVTLFARIGRPPTNGSRTNG